MVCVLNSWLTSDACAQVRLAGDLGTVDFVVDKLKAGRAAKLVFFNVPDDGCCVPEEEGLLWHKTLYDLISESISKMTHGRVRHVLMLLLVHATLYCPSDHAAAPMVSDTSDLGSPVWEGLSVPPDVEERGRGLWLGTAHGVVYKSEAESSIKTVEPSPSSAHGEEVAAEGGEPPAAAPTASTTEGPPAVTARLQRVDVAVSMGNGNVRVVGGEAVGGREAVMTVILFIRLHWDRIPGLRGGGVDGLDFFFSFPDRGGVELGEGRGLEGAILVAALNALSRRDAQVAPETAISLEVDELGQVLGAEVGRPVRPGVVDAIRALAATPGCKRLLVPKALATAAGVGEKIVGVDDVAGLLTSAMDVALAPMTRFHRLHFPVVEVWPAPPDDDTAAADSAASADGAAGVDEAASAEGAAGAEEARRLLAERRLPAWRRLRARTTRQPLLSR